MQLNLKDFISISGIIAAGDFARAKQGQVARMTDKTATSIGDATMQAEKQAYSEIDSAVQNILLENIGRAFPKQFNVVLEENDAKTMELCEKYFLKKNALEIGSYTLVIDPIDGSKNYLTTGIPPLVGEGVGGVSQKNFWAVSIAVIKDSEPLLGVMYYPNLNLILSSERGTGTWLNEKKITLMSDIHYYAPEHPIRISGSIGDISKDWTAKTVNSIHTGSLCVTFLSLLLTASNEPSSIFPTCFAYIGGNTPLYDLGAGPLMWTEAGGAILDTDGAKMNPYDETYTDESGDVRTSGTYLMVPNEEYGRGLLQQLKS